MSSSVWKTLFDQFSEVMDLVREGNRDPQRVSNTLQSIIDVPNMNPVNLPFLESNAVTGEEFVEEFENIGVEISEHARNVLLTDEFDEEHVTKGRVCPLGTEYDALITIPGEDIPSDKRFTRIIVAEATTHKLNNLFHGAPFRVVPAEVACLLARSIEVSRLRELEERGIDMLVVPHKPLKQGYPSTCGGLLSITRNDDRVRLEASHAKFTAVLGPEPCWKSEAGFVFQEREIFG